MSLTTWKPRRTKRATSAEPSFAVLKKDALIKKHQIYLLLLLSLPLCGSQTMLGEVEKF